MTDFKSTFMVEIKWDKKEWRAQLFENPHEHTVIYYSCDIYGVGATPQKAIINLSTHWSATP